jgi:hypothetical protein
MCIVGYRTRHERKCVTIRRKTMAHEDAGNYAGKRQGAELNDLIAARIKDKLRENTISCAEAHNIALKLNVDPADVGAAIDLLEVQINKCQLGLFEQGKEENASVAANKITPEVESAVTSSLVNGRLTCADAWKIAERFGLSRKAIGTACDTLKIKISACQIGAFK